VSQVLLRLVLAQAIDEGRGLRCLLVKILILSLLVYFIVLLMSRSLSRVELREEKEDILLCQNIVVFWSLILVYNASIFGPCQFL